jgi:methyl-accepting chemotaxis protein
VDHVDAHEHIYGDDGPRQSVDRTAEGARLVEETRATLERCAAAARDTRLLAAEIAGSSTAQASDMGGVRAAIQQLDDTIQQNAASAEESASASEEVAAQAIELSELIKTFKRAEALPHSTRSIERRSARGD